MGAPRGRVGAPPLARLPEDEAAAPSDPVEALSQAAKSDFAAGSALMSLLPLSARSTTIRIRGMIEEMIKQKSAAEAQRSEAAQALAMQRADASAAGFDPDEDPEKLAADIAKAAAQVKEFKAKQEAQKRKAARAAAGKGGGAAAPADEAAAEPSARALAIQRLQQAVFRLRREVASAKAEQSELGNALMRSATRLEDARSTASFVVSKRRAADEELHLVKRAWAQRSLETRRLFPLVVATAAQLHELEASSEAALNAAVVSAAHGASGASAASSAGATRSLAGSMTDPDAAAGSTAESLKNVLAKIVSAQAQHEPPASPSGTEGAGDGQQQSMVHALFHALGWSDMVDQAPGAAAAAAAAGGEGGGKDAVTMVSDKSGDLLRFLDGLGAGSSDLFATGDESAREAAAEGDSEKKDQSPEDWKRRRNDVFKLLCQRADALIQSMDPPPAKPADQPPASGPQGRKGRGGKGARSQRGAAPAAAAAAKPSATPDHAEVQTSKGLSAADRALGTSRAVGTAKELNGQIAVEALAWTALAFAAPASLSAAIAEALPSTSWAMPRSSAAFEKVQARCAKAAADVRARGEPEDAALAASAEARVAATALDVATDLVGWAEGLNAEPIESGRTVTPVVAGVLGEEGSGPGWLLAWAPWLPLPSRLHRQAMSLVVAGNVSMVSRFNRSVALQELQEARVAGAPAGMLLDWIQGCAAARSNTNAVFPAGTPYDGVASTAGLLGNPTTPEARLPEGVAGTLGRVGFQADSAWKVIGRHIIGNGASGRGIGPQGTVAGPAGAFVAMAVQAPMSFARKVVSIGTELGIVVDKATGARDGGGGTLPGGKQLLPGARRVPGAQRSSDLVTHAMVAFASHSAPLREALQVAADDGESWSEVHSKAQPGASGIMLPSTIGAELCLAARDEVTGPRGAAALLHALNVARGRVVAGGGGFATTAGDALPCPSSYLVPTPAALAETRVLFPMAETMHNALFDSIADSLVRASLPADASEQAFTAAAGEARRVGLPLGQLRTALPEVYHVLLACPEFTLTAVSVDPAADAIVESEGRLASTVLPVPAAGRTVRQAAEDLLAALCPEEDGAGAASASKPDQEVASASATLTEAAELATGIAAAIVGGRCMTGRANEHARFAVLALLRPDLCRVTRDSFHLFMREVARSSGLGERIDDSEACHQLRFATPSEAMLRALAAQVADTRPTRAELEAGASATGNNAAIAAQTALRSAEAAEQEVVDVLAALKKSGGAVDGEAASQPKAEDEPSDVLSVPSGAMRFMVEALEAAKAAASASARAAAAAKDVERVTAPGSGDKAASKEQLSFVSAAAARAGDAAEAAMAAFRRAQAAQASAEAGRVDARLKAMNNEVAPEWLSDPVEVVANRYASLAFLLQRAAGHLLVQASSSSSAARPSLAAAAEREARKLAAAGPGAGVDPALVFLAAHRMSAGWSQDEHAKRLALVRAQDAQRVSAAGRGSEIIGSAAPSQGPFKAPAGKPSAAAAASAAGHGSGAFLGDGGLSKQADPQQGTPPDAAASAAGFDVTSWIGGSCLGYSAAEEDPTAAGGRKAGRGGSSSALNRDLIMLSNPGGQDAEAGDPEEADPADMLPGGGGGGGGSARNDPSRSTMLDGSASLPASVAGRGFVSDKVGFQTMPGHGGEGQLSSSELAKADASLTAEERAAVEVERALRRGEQQKRLQAAAWSNADMLKMQEDARLAHQEREYRAKNPDHGVPLSGVRSVCASPEESCSVM